MADNSNDLVTGLNEARVNHIRALLIQLRQELTFLIKLESTQRSALNSVAQNRLEFVETSEEVVRLYYDVLDMSVGARDKILRNNVDFEYLGEIDSMLESLFEAVHDTYLLVGAICYDEGLYVKGLVEAAVNRKKPGMETYEKKLGKLFEQNGRRKPGSADDNNADKDGGSDSNSGNSSDEGN